MKKIIAFIFVLMFFANAAKAQYVNIPDSNFRAFLISKYPSCFNSAKMMDTACTSIVSEKVLDCKIQNISNLTGIEYFKNLVSLDCSGNYLIDLPPISFKLSFFDCSFNSLFHLPVLSDSLVRLCCTSNLIVSLPNLPNKLKYINCQGNRLTYLPVLPNALINLNCSFNQLILLPNLPSNIYTIDCKNNSLSSLPNLPDSIQNFDCSMNQINCLPFLPKKLRNLIIPNGVSCLPNKPYSLNVSKNLPICNITNNKKHCRFLPIIRCCNFIDLNSNGIKDSNELVKSNIKISLSNKKYSYTNKDGIAEINIDSLGIYTITASAPSFYNAVPSSYTHHFSSYDTIVYDTFALKLNTLIDSVSIKVTPLNWAARPGFAYPYFIQYENGGTTVLSPAINFNYDNSLLTYDSSSNNLVTNNGGNLGLSIGNLLPSQTGSFVAYFKVKTTAVLGTSLLSVANISSGVSNAVDSVKSVIRGSYDPNDKQATPTITKQDALDGKFINYTIRFQNTGTDTAFNVVIVDTLSSLLEMSNFQIISTSHLCKTTIKNNIIFFEFININLPDSGRNNMASNGFINFKIRPASTVTTGNVIPNKAHIYFDYNSSIKTNIATTTIINPLPLKLILFNAIANDNNNILVYWNTVNEINTAYFILEKSFDGIHFISTVEIAAKGFGDNNYFYSIPKSGKVFLRLKMVDKDGSVSYSKIILINSISTQHILISPNPVKNYLNITLNSTGVISLKCKLVNPLGAVVKSFSLKSGFHSINVSDLATGVYCLQTGIETIKIFVEK